MPRSATLMALLAGFLVLAILVGGGLLTNYANTIDAAHWTGYPLPPCFENAKSCGGHLLGTDENGRDVLARLIVGARVTLSLSLMAVLFELIIATALAMLARCGVIMNFIVMRIADAVSCLTKWLFLITAMLIYFDRHREYGTNPMLIALVAAVLSWPQLTRLAAITWSPRPLLRQTARDWATIIVLLSTIDFFGYGIQPPTPSWGNMLVNAIPNYVLAWWSVIFPAACIFLAVLLLELARRAVFKETLVN